MSNNDTITYDASGHVISPYYGYLPTKYICFIFLALFGVSTILHFGQALRYRAWWLLPTAVLAGVGEILGWSGRLWSSYSPQEYDAYLIQIVCTIIAPTPLVGAIFITFGRLSPRLGQHYSRLSARLYSRIFLTCDIIALIIQSVGGGLAGSANDDETGKLGSNIMLAGIIFQLVSLSIFSILMAEYFFRYMRGTPMRSIPLSDSRETLTAPSSDPEPMPKELKLLVIGICLEALFLFIRAIYRTIELTDGFHGRIIETEVYFNVLDGAMVVLAMYALNFFHPARLFSQHDERQPEIPMAKYSVSSV